MGGSGKTVVASSIAHDSEVGAKFGTICFAGVGQDSDGRNPVVNPDLVVMLQVFQG